MQSKTKLTTGSHFVWRKYLEQFADKNVVYVLNKGKGQIFTNKTENLAKVNNLYEFNVTVTPIEKKVCDAAFLSKAFNREMIQLVLVDLFDFLTNDFSNFLRQFSISESLIKVIQGNIPFKKYTDNQERLFSFYENNFTPVYNMLLKEDDSFYSITGDVDSEKIIYSETYITKMFIFLEKELMAQMLLVDDSNPQLQEQLKPLKHSLEKRALLIEEEIRKANPMLDEKAFLKFYFLHFLLSQYFRTYKFFNQLQKRSKQLPEERRKITQPEVLMSVAAHILSYNVAISCIADKKHIVFLKALEKDFITSDQPIINTLAKGIAKGETDVEFYYPLTPKLAILYTSQKKYTNIHSIILKQEEVELWNKMMYEEADNFIYAKDKESLIFCPKEV